MERVSENEQAFVPETALRIAKCFDYLLSDAAGLRSDIDYPDGQHKLHVTCEEPTKFVPFDGGVRLQGRRFLASITTVPAAGWSYTVHEAWAIVDDRATGFGVNLPLAPMANELSLEELAQWDELKRQKVLMILNTLLYGMFEVSTDEVV